MWMLHYVSLHFLRLFAVLISIGCELFLSPVASALLQHFCSLCLISVQGLYVLSSSLMKMASIWFFATDAMSVTHPLCFYCPCLLFLSYSRLDYLQTSRFVDTWSRIFYVGCEAVLVTITGNVERELHFVHCWKVSGIKTVYIINCLDTEQSKKLN